MSPPIPAGFPLPPFAHPRNTIPPVFADIFLRWLLLLIAPLTDATHKQEFHFLNLPEFLLPGTEFKTFLEFVQILEHGGIRG